MLCIESSHPRCDPLPANHGAILTPRAIWDPVYGCNPDTDAVQIELRFKARGDELGGRMGVRDFNGNYDFRWKGPGTSVNNPNRPWIGVTLVVVPKV
ncbi:hypothetical protein NUW58_g10024 [Xylaria curta]|uniref:Uncharacterized protein n=1 Tax=Xylaria curta TaxID=42375 RepID=A0ACC1MQN9_9PEZI|nr:hypothetical protein NUW58_g10024 [Xylaria curta]